MKYRGHTKNRQIQLDESASLPEGAVVMVEVAEDGGEAPAIWEKLLELAGTAEGLPPDLAENHDHYLYGTPKRD